MVSTSGLIFHGFFALNQKDNSLVYIPISNMEINHSHIISLTRFSIVRNRLQYCENIHDQLLPILNNCCSCIDEDLCIKCQLIRRQLKEIDLTNTVSVGEFMRYMYSNFTTDYYNLIFDLYKI